MTLPLKTRRSLSTRLGVKMTRTLSQIPTNTSCSSQVKAESGSSRYAAPSLPTPHPNPPSPTPSQIPKFLMERWSKFDAEGVQLAKIRIYDVPPGAAPRIIVLVPSDDGGDDDVYELDMVNQDVHNQVVVAERAKAPTGTGRARTTIMTGKVKHECNLRPRMTGRYERRLAARGAAAKSEKAVRVGLMDGARAGRGGGKMLSSGVSSAAGFADLTVRVCLPGGDRTVRLTLFFFFCSARRSSRKKGSTSAWRVCRATSCSTRCLRCSENANSGRSSFSARRRSSRKSISRRCCRKSRRCIAVGSSMACGSSRRASRAMAYVVVLLVAPCDLTVCVGQVGRHVAAVCVAAV
jgi:hypothetical protein